MNSSPTDSAQRDEPPNKKPQIGRREIGAFLLLLVINWTFAAGLEPGAAVTPPAEPATLVAS